MKNELMKMVENLFDTAEALNEKNFYDLIKIAEEVKLDVLFVRYGYNFHGDDTIWNAGVIVSPSQKFNHIYGDIKATYNPEEIDRILEYAIKTCNNKGIEVPIYLCLPENCYIDSTTSGTMRYAVRDIDALVPLELNDFGDYIEEIYETKVVGIK